MKKLLLIAALCAYGSGLQAKKEQADTRQHRDARAMAVDSLSHTLPHKFISNQTIEDAYDWIEETMDPKTHNKLLELQALAEQLAEQRKAMLLIEGITESSDAVRALDRQIDEVERQLDDLIYNGGALHWKTLLAVGVGAGIGFWAGKSRAGGLFSPVSWVTGTAGSGTGSRVTRGIIHGVLFTILIEYLLRGRRSVIGGNIYKLFKFVVNVIGKFFSKMFGRAGVADKISSFVEKQMRPLGKKLDNALKGYVGPILVIGVTAILIGVAMHCTKEKTQPSR